MNNQKKFYLSTRVLIFSVVVLCFNLLLLIYIALMGFENQRYIGILVFFIIFILVIYCSYVWIYKPFKETNKALRLFFEGYILNGIYEIRVPFSYECTLAFVKFKELINTKELINNSKKHAEYLALQNQINPHFLYNTLEGIRSEALIEGVESVAEMTEALATFFRYTISDVEKLVTLEDELGNVKNYYTIQQFRFGDRLELDIELDAESQKELFKIKIPKLTLQPIVENSIFHGVERKMGKGCLRIKVIATSRRVIITISDNGLGIEEQLLIKLNKRLRGTTLEYMKDDYNQKGGIALINVNNRIKLIFGDEYGVYVYSKINAGTDVEITLPLVKE